MLRPIPSCPGYWACADGTILNSRGKVLSRSIIRGRGKNVVRFATKVVVAGARKNCLVSRLICEAFWGPPPTAKHQAAHNNGQSFDDNPDNLRWATPIENMADQLLHGTRALGSSKYGAKLNEAIIVSLRAMHAEELKTGRKIARPRRIIEWSLQYGVSTQVISDAIAYRKWKHV